MKRKIVILGAAGTVGSKISAILLQEGHQVTLIARHTAEEFANEVYLPAFMRQS